jgi:hypothetical protein
MGKASVVGVYKVEGANNCHLVEMEISDCQGPFDFSRITQRVMDQPPSNWQVPYAEQLISWDGTKILTDALEFENPVELWKGDIRIGFYFHFLDFRIPLQTPFGDVRLPAPSSRPERLSIFERYEEP